MALGDEGAGNVRGRRGKALIVITRGRGGFLWAFFMAMT